MQANWYRLKPDADRPGDPTGPVRARQVEKHEGNSHWTLSAPGEWIVRLGPGHTRHCGSENFERDYEPATDVIDCPDCPEFYEDGVCSTCKGDGWVKAGRQMDGDG